MIWCIDLNRKFIDMTYGCFQSSDINTVDPQVYEIENVTSSDEGWYACLVGNSNGASYRHAYLNVVPGECQCPA